MNGLDSIFDQYADEVYKYLYCLCHNYSLAEELTQETFYQAVKSINRYNGKCKMSVWLCQIGKHTYYKYLEKHKKEMLSDLQEHQDKPGHMCVETSFFNSCDRVDLYKEIHLLEDPLKEVFLLRTLGDLKFREIGEILGGTENWARVTYYRAKVKLKERRTNNEREL